MAELSWIDWDLLQQRDFKKDPDNPEKVERYQAEALVHRKCPVDALLGIACYDERVQKDLAFQLEERGLKLKLIVKPRWYF